MSTIAVHLAITLFVLAALMTYIDRKNLKYVPVLILFGVLPDLDVFIGIHRATFHNIFFAAAPVIIGIFLFLIFRKLKIKKLEKKQIFFCLASGFLILHIVLDMFCGGAFALYPVSQELIDCSSSLTFVIKESKPLQKEDITEIAQNVSQIPKNKTLITNVTSPPRTPDITTPALTPSPTPSSEISHDIVLEFERNKPKNISEVNYITIPTKDYPKTSIIKNGVELIFLITAAMTCVIRYFEPNFKKLKGN